MIEVVRHFYQYLIQGDLEGMLSLCAKDVTLNWGPYTFNGKEGVEQWMQGLREIFPLIGIKEAGIMVEKNSIKHEFFMDISIPEGNCQRGVLPALSTYRFVNDKLREISIALSSGVLIYSEEEVKRLGL